MNNVFTIKVPEEGGKLGNKTDQKLKYIVFQGYFNGISDVKFQESACSGKEATCPASLPMADSTKCIDRGECRGGKCIPFCETQDLQVRSINICSTNMAQYIN